MSILFIIISALFIDKLLGEPKRFHPLVAFGHWAALLEKKLNIFNKNRPLLMAGVLACCLAILPWLAILHGLKAVIDNSLLLVLLDIAVLYFVIGWQSLQQHILAIKEGLQHSLEQGQEKLSWIVSRQTDQLDESQVAQASLESLLENSNDALFASLLLYLVAELVAQVGIEVALLHRLANTLDAMWGYRTKRYEYFGKFAAKVDDMLAYLPARITALLFVVVSLLKSNQAFKRALFCWRHQAKHCASPNGGVVMCTGAGALAVSLSAVAFYQGQQVEKPAMGLGPAAGTDDLQVAIDLIQQSLALLLAIICLLLLL